MTSEMAVGMTKVAAALVTGAPDTVVPARRRRFGPGFPNIWPSFPFSLLPGRFQPPNAALKIISSNFPNTWVSIAKT